MNSDEHTDMEPDVAERLARLQEAAKDAGVDLGEVPETLTAEWLDEKAQLDLSDAGSDSAASAEESVRTLLIHPMMNRRPKTLPVKILHPKWKSRRFGRVVRWPE